MPPLCSIAATANWAPPRRPERGASTGGLVEPHPAVADLRWWHQIRRGNPGESGVQRADLYGGQTHPDAAVLPGRSNAIAVEFGPSVEHVREPERVVLAHPVQVVELAGRRVVVAPAC
jgi:hypothetical protein